MDLPPLNFLKHYFRKLSPAPQCTLLGLTGTFSVIRMLSLCSVNEGIQPIKKIVMQSRSAGSLVFP